MTASLRLVLIGTVAVVGSNAFGQSPAIESDFSSVDRAVLQSPMTPPGIGAAGRSRMPFGGTARSAAPAQRWNPSAATRQRAGAPTAPVARESAAQPEERESFFSKLTPSWLKRGTPADAAQAPAASPKAIAASTPPGAAAATGSAERDRGGLRMAETYKTASRFPGGPQTLGNETPKPAQRGTLFGRLGLTGRDTTPPADESPNSALLAGRAKLGVAPQPSSEPKLESAPITATHVSAEADASPIASLTPPWHRAPKADPPEVEPTTPSMTANPFIASLAKTPAPWDKTGAPPKMPTDDAVVFVSDAPAATAAAAPEALAQADTKKQPAGLAQAKPLPKPEPSPADKAIVAAVTRTAPTKPPATSVPTLDAEAPTAAIAAKPAAAPAKASDASPAKADAEPALVATKPIATKPTIETLPPSEPERLPAPETETAPAVIATAEPALPAAIEPISAPAPAAATLASSPHEASLAQPLIRPERVLDDASPSPLTYVAEAPAGRDTAYAPQPLAASGAPVVGYAAPSADHAAMRRRSERREPSERAKALLTESHGLAQQAATVKEYSAILQRCRYVLAIDDSEQAVDYANQLAAWALNNRGEALVEERRPDEAEVDFQDALRCDANCWRAEHNLGVLDAQRGEVESALERFNRTIELHPEFAKAYSNRAALAVQTGDFGLALDEYERAIEVDPDLAVAHTGRGRVCHLLGYLDEAIRHFDAAEYLSPEDATIVIGRADLLVDLGRYGHAKAAYERAIELAPNEPTAYRNLAWMQATCPSPAFRDGAAAVENAQRALDLSADEDDIALDTQAAALAAAGRFDDAAVLQRRAIEIAPPADAGVYFERLTMYERGEEFTSQPIGDVRHASYTE